MKPKSTYASQRKCLIFSGPSRARTIYFTVLIIRCLTTLCSRGHLFGHHIFQGTRTYPLCRPLQVSASQSFFLVPNQDYTVNHPNHLTLQQLDVNHTKFLIYISPPPQPPYSIGGCGGGGIILLHGQSLFCFTSKPISTSTRSKILTQPKAYTKSLSNTQW